MSLAQRKIDLINWISSLTSEEYLDKLEEIKDSIPTDLPQELLHFLKSADTDSLEGLREHTSVKDIKR